MFWGAATGEHLRRQLHSGGQGSSGPGIQNARRISGIYQCPPTSRPPPSQSEMKCGRNKVLERQIMMILFIAFFLLDTTTHQGGIQNRPQARAPQCTQPWTQEGRPHGQGFPAGRHSGPHHRRVLASRVLRIMPQPHAQRGSITRRRQLRAGHRSQSDRRPPRRRVSRDPFFLADCGKLLVGWVFCRR